MNSSQPHFAGLAQVLIFLVFVNGQMDEKGEHPPVLSLREEMATARLTH